MQFSKVFVDSRYNKRVKKEEEEEIVSKRSGTEPGSMGCTFKMKQA